MPLLKSHPHRWVLLKKALISFLVNNPDQYFIFNYIKTSHDNWDWRICHPNEVGSNPTKWYLLRERWYDILYKEVKASITAKVLKLKQAWEEK